MNVYPLVLRLLAAAGLLASTFIFLHRSSHQERKPTRQPLFAIPTILEQWHGTDVPLEPRIVTAVGVDDYVNRIYEARGDEVQVYLGYYASQRTGDAIHSPKNCLPAVGWEPVREGRLSVTLPTGPPVVINDYLVEKGLDRQLILYWYQGRGRIVASEYKAKLWMVVDALTTRRTDGALVRIATSTRDGEVRARRRALAFFHTLYPRLKDFVPE